MRRGEAIKQCLQEPLAGCALASQLVTEYAAEALVFFRPFDLLCANAWWRGQTKYSGYDLTPETMALVDTATVARLQRVIDLQIRGYYDKHASITVVTDAARIDGFLHLFPDRTRHSSGADLINIALEMLENDEDIDDAAPTTPV